VLKAIRCAPFESDEEATEEISNCSEAASEFFGDPVPPWLFGSRSILWFRDALEGRCWSIFHLNGFILRDASLRDAPQDEVSDPHGEECAFARLEP